MYQGLKTPFKRKRKAYKEDTLMSADREFECFTCHDRHTSWDMALVGTYYICYQCHEALYHYHHGDNEKVYKELVKIDTERHRKEEFNDKVRHISGNPITIDDICDWSFRMTKEGIRAFENLK